MQSVLRRFFFKYVARMLRAYLAVWHTFCSKSVGFVRRAELLGLSALRCVGRIEVQFMYDTPPHLMRVLPRVCAFGVSYLKVLGLPTQR